MKRFTISSARDLIKRELGISAAALTAPDDMNQNSDYPWYEMHFGNLRIEVNTDDIRQGKFTDKMIALRVTHENSNKETTEYFYGDTLEYASPYTEWKNREIYCETMEHPENDTALRRLKREAQDDGWNHFHVQTIIQEGKSEVNNSNNLHSDAILEKAAFENFEGKLLQGHDLFNIRVFDHRGNYIPESEVYPIDETQLDWWIKEVTHGVNNNPDKTAGFSVFQWDRKDGTWMAYQPDGENQLRYDTGRRSDGTVHEECIQQIPAMIFAQLPEKEHTPFNDLLIQSSKSKSRKQSKHNEPER